MNIDMNPWRIVFSDKELHFSYRNNFMVIAKSSYTSI